MSCDALYDQYKLAAMRAKAHPGLRDPDFSNFTSPGVMGDVPEGIMLDSRLRSRIRYELDAAFTDMVECITQMQMIEI